MPQQTQSSPQVYGTTPSTDQDRPDILAIGLFVKGEPGKLRLRAMRLQAPFSLGVGHAYGYFRYPGLQLENRTDSGQCSGQAHGMDCKQDNCGDDQSERKSIVSRITCMHVRCTVCRRWTSAVCFAFQFFFFFNTGQSSQGYFSAQVSLCTWACMINMIKFAMAMYAVS